MNELEELKLRVSILEKNIEEAMMMREDMKEEPKAEEKTCSVCGKYYEYFPYEFFDEMCNPCRQKLRVATNKKSKEITKEIFNNPKFLECKNDTERKVFVELLHPELVNNRFFDARIISKEAKAMYKMTKNN